MTNGDATDNASAVNGGGSTDAAAEEDPRAVEFRQMFKAAESRLMNLFGTKEEEPLGTPKAYALVDAAVTRSEPRPKKPTRNIDEEDYGDEDEDEQEDEAEADPAGLPSAHLEVVKITQTQQSPSELASRPSLDRTASIDHSKTSNDAAKQGEEDQEAAEEETAKRDFHLYFYTLENDRVAMLEQQKLDELDRQVEAEVSGEQNDTRNAASSVISQSGTLSASNLGASSLMLGNLLKRIDSKRGMVAANDAQLRRLISEVRKNRSKWASEDKVNQEELYEPAEKVLMNLKAMTEYSTPFLQRVSKREANDYYHVIKNPMDIGTMMKKLKTLQYKNRTEIVADLNLIWNNCLLYNSDPNHPLRKKALYLQKKTDELIRHIPDVEVRDRAEVEAEERRNARLDAELEGIEDSDDEEPIMASRGRKAPSKSNKGGSIARKALPVPEGTPVADTKPHFHSLGSSSNLKNQFLRADSDVPMENGFGTPPPPGRLTPMPNGVAGDLASQADASEADAAGQLLNDMPMEATEDPEADDLEYRMWKQVTKKARATIASQRNRLFRADRINAEEPALLRTKAGMRQWIRQQKKALGEDDDPTDASPSDAPQAVSNETLAEAMEEENDTLLPDYYDPLSAIPDIASQLRWEDDTEGNVVMHSEETLRMLPVGHFMSPESVLTKKMEANMRQMQETRKVCAKIGVVKQMQLQSQMYSNQFQRYEPTPFLEQDAETTVVSDDGPFMAPWLCRATFQRSIAKIFFHAGFEEFQPSALDAVTDMASSYFQNMVQTMATYAETSRMRESESRDLTDAALPQKQASLEENVLHTLDEQGLDVEALESYVKDDVERLGNKLGVMHERMKAHLADLLVSRQIIHHVLILIGLSGPLLIQLKSAQMVLVLSTMIASNSPVVILQKTLVKISSDSRSSDWTVNMA
jgi:transcriptional activator SPT7